MNLSDPPLQELTAYPSTRTLNRDITTLTSDLVPLGDILTLLLSGYLSTLLYVTTFGAVAGTAWEQQKLFFGPICRGLSRRGAAFMCGTNMVIRRKALDEVGGMCEDNIAEDFLTSFFMHQRGWQSVYVPIVLAEGLAPEDLGSFYKQQYRWARGSLEIVFKYNPFFRRGLTMSQRFEYLVASSYWLSGFIVLLNLLLPLTFGLGTVNIYTQIGLVTLIGLISKHGILMVDYANHLQQSKGLGRREAIEEAAAIRLRPILMTTAAMVIAMVPLIISTGAGAASRFAIGIVIAFGMTVGTLFTLFVTPAVYTYIAREHNRDAAATVPSAANPLNHPAE